MRREGSKENNDDEKKAADVWFLRDEKIKGQDARRRSEEERGLQTHNVVAKRLAGVCDELKLLGRLLKGYGVCGDARGRNVSVGVEIAITESTYCDLSGLGRARWSVSPATVFLNFPHSSAPGKGLMYTSAAGLWGGTCVQIARLHPGRAKEQGP